MMPDDRFTFSFTATGDGPPAEIRVRRMLKAALRHYGLRASFVPTPATPAASPPTLASVSTPDAGKVPFRATSGHPTGERK
jgi:hypothetical protein